MTTDLSALNDNLVYAAEGVEYILLAPEDTTTASAVLSASATLNTIGAIVFTGTASLSASATLTAVGRSRALIRPQTVGFTPGFLSGQDPEPLPVRAPLEVQYAGRQAIGGGDFLDDFPWSRIIPVAHDEFWIVFWDRYPGPSGHTTMYVRQCIYSPASDSFSISDAVPVIGGAIGTSAVPPFTDPADSTKHWNDTWDAFAVIPLDSDRFLLRFADLNGRWDSASFGTGSGHATSGLLMITMDWDAGAVDSYGAWQSFYSDPVTHETGEFTEAGWDGRMIRLDDGRLFNAYQDTSTQLNLCVGTINETTGHVTWATPYKPGPSDFFEADDEIFCFQVNESEVVVWWKPNTPVGADHGAAVAVFSVDGSGGIAIGGYTTVDVPLNGNARYNNDVLGWPSSFSLAMPSPGVWVLQTDYKHSVGSSLWDADILMFTIDQIDGTHAATFTQPFDDFAYLNPDYEGYGGNPFNYPSWNFFEVAVFTIDQSVLLVWDDKTDLPAVSTVPTIPNYWQHMANDDGIFSLGFSGTAGGVYGVDEVPINDTTFFESYPISHLAAIDVSTGGQIMVGAFLDFLVDGVVESQQYNLNWWRYGVTTGA